ncbi:hypothetical protein OE88DRAFT_1089271 [Heliocybe sulcata]|uniref:Uncharacterized protein n=1 Tax=Heliocybe sulcata TaxID=5364 RepID=A0A5C3MM24_9AGAM|nr:hypothetical protein OE88DRAFT_1089271 [Heliocybe sulcata]
MSKSMSKAMLFCATDLQTRHPVAFSFESNHRRSGVRVEPHYTILYDASLARARVRVARNMETDTPLDCDYCDLRGEELSLQDISFRRVCGLNAARSAGMTAAQEAGMTKELRRDNLDDKVSPQLLPEKETQDMNIVTPAETHARNHNAASVHRLPHEMLSMIMVDVVDTYGVRFLGRCFTPLTLSQVCQRWRHVALETPQIWRAVYIVQAAPYIRASTPGVTRLQAQAAFMDTCVARAGGLPLDLFFSIDCVSDDVPELLPAWRRYITRCESLCLCFTREVWDAFFDTIVSGPILKELAISGARTSDPLPLQNLVMPRLQSLALDASGQEVIFTGLPEGVNWSQIINLCLEDVEFGHSLATVLNQCTTVKSLRLCIEEFRVEEGVAEGESYPISSPELRPSSATVIVRRRGILGHPNYGVCGIHAEAIRVSAGDSQVRGHRSLGK